MSYTIEQVRGFSSYAKETLEAGEYTFRVAKVLQKKADRGFNMGKDVIVLVSNPLNDNNNTESFDRSRSLFSEFAIPVFPDTTEDKEAMDQFQKGLRSVAYWAECLGVVDASPAKTGDKAADWAAYEEWAIAAANALVTAPESLAGKCFNGTITVNDKGYPKLSKKTPVAPF